MSLYRELAKRDLAKILSEYGITMINSFQLLHGGSENSNYKICTTAGNYILTVCENKSSQESAVLAKTLNHLKRHGFTTSQIYPNLEGKLFSKWHDKTILLKSFIPGEVKSDFSAIELRKIGHSIAKLHKIPVPEFVPKEFAYGLAFFDDLYRYEVQSDFGKWLSRKMAKLLTNISEELPRSLVHGDIFDSNIIVNTVSKSITIMDFEEACQYYRIFDLGMCFVGICRMQNSLNLEKVKIILNAYQAAIHLTELELRSLHLFAMYAAIATAFWRYRQFKYINPVTELENSFIEMQLLADWIDDNEDAFASLIE